MVQGADTLLPRGSQGDGRAESRAGSPVEGQGLGSFRNRLAGAADAEDILLRQLAADHLRELRDDGVTLDYVARMYGITPERLEILYRELVPSPPS